MRRPRRNHRCVAFALALLLNYLVVASQFNSFRYPLYLLLTVPLALVGAFWLFYLTGQALDVISVLGVVILIGLVTKTRSCCSTRS